MPRDEKRSRFDGRRSPAECVNIREVAEKIPEAICRGQRDKVTASVTFARAEQLRRLLTWLVDRSLEKQPVAPSEKDIAAAVLNRKDFDPQTDSLVRKEMSRLREKLSRYYSSEGLHDEVHIRVGGGYLIGFARSATFKPVGGRSCWLLLPFRSSAEMLEQGEQLLEELLFALSESNGPDLIALTTALAYRGRAGDVREFAAECEANFVLEGRLRKLQESIELTAWFVDGQSGRALRSKRFNGGDPADLARLATNWLLEEDPEE